MSAISLWSGKRCVGQAVRTIAVGLCLVFVASLALGQISGRMETFDEARQLEEAGKPHEAFLKYLAAPGGEYAAATLARPQAREFLKLLADQGATIPAARRRLIEAELLLATRDKDGALAAFRDVATKIATTDEQGWEQGLLPRAAYFFEPPQLANTGAPHMPPFDSHRESPAVGVGPGSHRDNWLLRRFIALEAWDDARREFARVWQLHREATQPYFVRVPTNYDKQGKPTGHERRVVQPAGFNAAGLQFALDFAFFLQRRDQADQARAVLIEALTLIDMDRNPRHRPWSDPIPEGEPINVPERPIHVHYRSGEGGATRSEFIRLAFGTLKTAGREEELVKTLTTRIEAGENRLRRVLAQVRLLQGQPDAALQLELDFIVTAKFDPLSTAYRRAVIFDSAQNARAAVTEYELVLALLNREDQKPARPNLPDPAEPVWNGRLGSQQAGLPMAMFRPGPSDPRQALRTNVLAALERLHAGLGETDQALEMARQLMAASPWAGQLGPLEELERKHRAVNQSARFVEWAKQQLSVVKDHNMRAALQWLLGDRKAAAES
ncbi:MAG: hypothetical protein IAG10_04790, partial [Planctomycetaceae bacterium]|nr:hypothetical protein [Planctomycetaceae bacterium]